jgi:hypothetical protein
MASFPRKRESSRSKCGQWPEEPTFFRTQIMRSLRINGVLCESPTGNWEYQPTHFDSARENLPATSGRASNETNLLSWDVSSLLRPEPGCMTFVHFPLQPPGHVILSGAKNLSERPFVALRVTTLVCRSLAVRSSGAPERTCSAG